MQGKGGHDGDAAVIKRLILRLEHALQRSPDATGVFETITCLLGKSREILKMFPLLPKMECHGDERLLKLIQEGTITHRLNILFLEEHEKVLEMRAKGYQHVHHIERTKKIPTTITVTGSDDFKEIFIPKQDLTKKNHVIWLSTQSCPCVKPDGG